MRLDHLLSKEEKVEEKPAKAEHYLIIQVDWIRQINMEHLSGGDALRGHTRSHPEHDG